MKKLLKAFIFVFIIEFVFIYAVSFANVDSNSILTSDLIIENDALEFEEKIEENEIETEEIEEEKINEIVIEDTMVEDVQKEESIVGTSSNYASIRYRTHAQNIGWQKTFKDGETAGTHGMGLRLEAIEITIDSNLSGNVVYNSYVENIGWQKAVSNGQESGTNGMGLRLEALRISLEGEIADYYDIYYRVHAQNVGWLDWAKNGTDAGTAGYGFRLEGIEIVLSKKNENGESVAPGRTAVPYKDKVNIIYRSYVQNIGAMKFVANGKTSGTSGQGLRIEGMNIKAETTRTTGDIVYTTYVQNKGWMDPVKNGAYAGTTGQGLRMEAIKIHLTGKLAEKFDIYYRVHSQQFGWLDWAKNGEPSGTVGYNYRLEAIQIVLVNKNGAAPGNTTKPYRERVEFIIENMEFNRTTLKVGDTFKVKYHTVPVNPINATPKFEALNPDIATIDNTGLITAKSKGIANFVMYDSEGFMTAGFYVIIS